MRKGILQFLIWIFVGSCLVDSANAIGTGFYLGLNLGLAQNSGKSQTVTVSPTGGGPPVTVTASPQRNSAGVRIFFGYQVVEYLAGELGFAYYTVVDYNLPATVLTNTNAQTGIAVVDLVAKADLTFCGFDFFAKAGPAIIYQGTSRSIRPAINKSKYQTYVRPTWTLGAGYAMTPRWVADISWTQIMNTNYLKNVNFYALGISYHFVDVFCGQFLCDE